ncbi:hypothetical protein [Piscirickettsia salmonis]|nr:hypothetical protein [Piscirickettsia salmonis]ERL61227.1 hypothetical protein K661_02436 [Piscirickettsia salmonis LF-89 = ATCC VR-1361]WGZ70594.1 hypothetical protein E3220_02240 [Piscirickettsia salmonis EM-90]APS58393.1 hypothetical protein AVI52_14865 [Piscirickettsia salmonis]PEQ15734.1 hypothetical protein X973_11085 [Piscirickettsia salmonis]QGN76732.1 hypothetical protein Psal001_00923 [Piscirickettsia salmonis]
MTIKQIQLSEENRGNPKRGRKANLLSNMWQGIEASEVERLIDLNRDRHQENKDTEATITLSKYIPHKSYSAKELLHYPELTMLLRKEKQYLVKDYLLTGPLFELRTPLFMIEAGKQLLQIENDFRESLASEQKRLNNLMFLAKNKVKNIRVTGGKPSCQWSAGTIELNGVSWRVNKDSPAYLGPTGGIEALSFSYCEEIGQMDSFKIETAHIGTSIVELKVRNKGHNKGRRAFLNIEKLGLVPTAEAKALIKKQRGQAN